MGGDGPAPAGACPLVVLAGGASSRMGQTKGLLPYPRDRDRDRVHVHTRPWFVEQLARFRAAGGSHAILVVGFDAAAYTAAVAALATGSEGEAAVVADVRLRVVVNALPARGSFSSLQCGLSSCSEATGAWVLPIDVPCAAPGTISAMASHLTSGIDAVVPTWDGRGGHPVLISAAFARRLRALPSDAPDARLDVQLRTLDAGAIVRVSVNDPGVRMNVNTPADWAELLGPITGRMT